MGSVRRPGQLFAAVLLPLAVSTVLNAVMARHGETVWAHVSAFATGTQGADSWKPMETARRYTDAHAGSADGLYAEVFFYRGIKFQYPPSALLFIDHLDRRVLNAVSWVASLVTMLAAVAIFHRTAGRVLPGSRSSRWSWAADAAVAGVALTFYPIVKAYSLGQIQSWLNALFAAALLAWTAGAFAAAGIAIGVMSLIKPMYAFLLLWTVARARWRAAVAGASTIGLGLAAAMLRYGLHGQLDYLRVLTYIGRRGEAFYANQSFNGALNRLTGNGANLDWQSSAFAPIHPVVAAGTALGFVALVAAALILPLRTPAHGSALDLSLMALSVTATAPIAWEHHYGILLSIYALAAPVVLAGRPFRRWQALAIGTSVVATGNYFEFTKRFAATGANPLQSYLLFGALLLLPVLYTAVADGRDV